jgi:hypothetical protein
VIRRLILLGGLLSWHAALAEDQESDYGPEATAEDLLDMWLNPGATTQDQEPASKWEGDASLNLGIGYKENVQFSSFNPRNSTFSMAEVEGFLFNLHPEINEFYVYAFADQHHYFDLKRGEDEQTFTGQAGYKHHHHRFGSVGSEVHLFYIDQFFDAAFSEIELNAIRLKQYEIGGVLTYGRRFGERTTLGAAAGGFRSQLSNSPDDYDRGLKRLDLKYVFDRATVKAELQRGNYDYDSRLRREARGGRLDGSTDIRSDQARITTSWHWDTKKAFYNRLQGTRRQVDDNGGGYYNYNSWQILYRLQHRRGPWTSSLSASYREADYGSRPANIFNLDNEVLYRRVFRSRLRIERAWENWTAFAETSWEDTTSNDPLDTYQQLAALLGIGYTFD